MTRVFLRDDDVGELTPRLRTFVELFAGRGLPVSYQIIPALFTAECAAWLRARAAERPELFEFGQHGLRHEMTVRGRREFYEYGPEVPYEAQLASIREGQALLRERLGDLYDPAVFTPPRHRYDRNTLRALKAAGVSVLSASSYASLPHRAAYLLGRTAGLTNLGRPGVSYHCGTRPDSGLFELSIAVAVDDGALKSADVGRVLAEFERARRHMPVVGLMFHHNAYAKPEAQAFLAELADALARLPDVRFETLDAIRAALADEPRRRAA